MLRTRGSQVGLEPGWQMRHEDGVNTAQRLLCCCSRASRMRSDLCSLTHRSGAHYCDGAPTPLRPRHRTVRRAPQTNTQAVFPFIDEVCLPSGHPLHCEPSVDPCSDKPLFVGTPIGHATLRGDAHTPPGREPCCNETAAGIVMSAPTHSAICLVVFHPLSLHYLHLAVQFRLQVLACCACVQFLPSLRIL